MSTAEQILAEIAANFAQDTGQCDICPANDVTCMMSARSCDGCQFRKTYTAEWGEEDGECILPDDQECPNRDKCAPALIKYAQQKAEKSRRKKAA